MAFEQRTVMLPPDFYASILHQRRYVRDTSRPFEENVSAGQRKRIAKCAASGYEAGRSIIARCYPVVADNRARKGREYGMRQLDWEMLLLEEGDYVRCFAVEPDTIAAALCVLVAPDILYVSGWGDKAGYEHFSPVTLLCKGIYEWCANNGVRLMDIGIADEQSLADFKMRLGFRPTC